MRSSDGARRRSTGEAGFTLVELTIVVVISTIALLAIYQSLITQERTYRYQSAAIDAQATSRMALQVVASELREISAGAGAVANQGGSDLLVATADSIRVRAFRKVGIVCSVDVGTNSINVWVPGTAFVAGDAVLLSQAGNTNTDDDDTWVQVNVSSVGASTNPTCSTLWNTYPVQNLRGFAGQTATVQAGSLIRSFVSTAYGNYAYDGMNVLGRRQNNVMEPLVGPILPPAEGGLRFRYFNANNTEVTSLGTEAQRSTVARVNITVRAVSQGGNPNGGDWIDSVTTNVYLRGN